jgi:sulfonate transport system permease protein
LKLRINLISIIKGAVAPLIIIFLWQVGSTTGFLPSSIIAPPLPAFANFFKLFFNGEFLNHFLISSERLFAGFILGSSFGIIFGLIIGYKKKIAQFLEPLFLILIPVPPLAWIPFLIIFFGPDNGAKTALISTGCFATMFLSTSLGVKGIDNRYLEVCRIYKKNDIEIITKVLLPFALPIIFSSLRVAMALSWTLLMASEMIKASSGLGWFINDSRNFSRSEDLVAGIMIVGLLGKLTDLGVVRLGKHLTRWQDKYTGND